VTGAARAPASDAGHGRENGPRPEREAAQQMSRRKSRGHHHPALFPRPPLAGGPLQLVPRLLDCFARRHDRRNKVCGRGVLVIAPVVIVVLVVTGGGDVHALVPVLSYLWRVAHYSLLSFFSPLICFIIELCMVFRYVNSWSGEVKWKQPLEMTLLPHLSKEYAPPVDEEGEDDEEDDDEEDDDDEEEEIEEENGGWAEIEGEDGAAEVGDYDAIAGDY